MLRLCSSSLTRAQLLTHAGIPFFQESIDFDEDAIIASSPKNFVYQATLGKYRVNLAHFGCSDYPLLVADTVVTAQGKILRKAKDEADARTILATQSGSEVAILTCMIYKTPFLELMDISSTHYFFDPFNPEEVDQYIASGEWRGKAGACMVEGFCQPYIRETRGFESTAMGLNVEILKRFLVKISNEISIKAMIEAKNGINMESVAIDELKAEWAKK
jgi:septum formation protein